jgi:gas vesicle protein
MRTFLIAAGGAAVGAGVALLFSPEGKGTRTVIRDKTLKCTKDFADFTGRKARHMRNKMKGYQHHVSEAVEQGQELLSQGKESFGSVEAVVAQGQEMVEHVKEAVTKAKTAMEHASTTDTQPTLA